MNINERTDEFIERFWKWRQLDIPEFATFLKRHEYDDRLMDMSLNGYLRRRDDAKFFLSETRKLKEVALKEGASYESLFHLDYLEDDLDSFVKGLAYKTYLCPLNPIEGPHVRFPGLLSWMKRDTVTDIEKILSRLRLFPRHIDQHIELMTEGIRLGIVMHIKSVEAAPKALLACSETTVEDSKLFGPFKDRPDTISREVWDGLVNSAKTVIENECLPSFKRFSVFISDTYIPNCRPSEGLCTLPNGKEIYEAYVRFHTEPSVTARQIYDLGHEQLKIGLQHFEEIKEKAGFKGTRAEFIKYIRTDEKFRYKTEEQMMTNYNRICDKIMAVLPKYFSKMPDSELKVVPAPEEIAPEYVNGAYMAGAPDKSRPGYFVLNTYKPEIRKTLEGVVLTVHEALPGHHIQLSLAMDAPIKEYRRFADELRYWDPPAHLGMKSAYHEGWASYAEYLGIEMGLYDDDVYDMVAKVYREIMLACRLIADAGIHAFGWTRQQTIDLFMENTALEEYDIITEVDRYIALPGQALGYKYGELKMIELRKKAESCLGKNFNLADYHYMVCTIGDVPLFLLERQVNKYISDQSKLEKVD